MITHKSFLRLAQEIASNSKATRLKVGAVLVNKNNHIIGTGYNGTPKGSFLEEEGMILDEDKTLAKAIEITYTQPWVIHAELNAVLNATTNDLEGTILYCTHSPCVHCSSVLVQKGIKKVYYIEDYRSHDGTNLLINHKVEVNKIKL